MSKKIEKGDRIRFLDEVGGGIVTRVEGNLVFIEDEDGFEIPMPIFEVVVIEQASEIASETGKSNSGNEPQSSNEPVSEKEAFHTEMEEEEHDDFNPRFYLAFTKDVSRKEDESLLLLHLINDSNYYCVYLISSLGEDGLMYANHQGIIQPNTKLSLESMELQQLDVTWDFQLILFKKGKGYPSLAPISTSVNIKPKKFFRENSFVTNDFFHQPAVLMPIIKNELELRMEKMTSLDARSIILEKEAVEIPKRAVKRQSTPELLEIDLHIHELIDSVVGMSNGEILQVQLDRFNVVMEENRSAKGRKLVFIHGVGNGTLKTELRKQLDRKYKGIDYQDASFKEYGFGATMVIIK